MRLGVQPYTLHELDEPTTRTIRRIADARFEAVELGPDANTEVVNDVIAETGLAVSSLAGGLDLLESLDAYVDASDAFETSDVVVMWADPEQFTTHGGIEGVAAELEVIADELADHGLRLHYHNHDHEFAELGDATGYHHLVEQTDEVFFELDLGWAGAGGVDPAGLLRTIGDRVTHVHVKDMDFADSEFVTFGEGDLDLGDTIDAARDTEVEWMLFENDHPEDPVAEVSHASLLLDRHTGHICA